MKSAFLKVAIVIAFFYGSTLAVLAVSDIEEVINAKTKELQEIHQRIEETQNNLVQTEKRSRGLNQEIKRSNYLINQLNLTIKSQQINIEKMGLEIVNLEDNILSTDEAIALKSEAINKILRELQIKDNEGLVATLLRGESLAESLAEIQNLSEIKIALVDDVDDLLALKEEKNNKLNQVAGKKKNIEREHVSSKINKSLTEEQRVENKELLALTKNQADAYEKELDALAKRQAEIAEEIERMEAELRSKINPDLLPPARPGVISWPIERGYKYITQGYGATKFARYAYKGQWHNGIDIGRPLGTSIVAAEGGIVMNSGDQDKFCRKGAYGKYLVIRHENNLVTLYAHLSRQAVAPGDRVAKGDVIGYVGTTGYSTGPHLHFTLYDGNTFKMQNSTFCGLMPTGGDLDPTKYL